MSPPGHHRGTGPGTKGASLGDGGQRRFPNVGTDVFQANFGITRLGKAPAHLIEIQPKQQGARKSHEQTQPQQALTAGKANQRQGAATKAATKIPPRLAETVATPKINTTAAAHQINGLWCWRAK